MPGYGSLRELAREVLDIADAGLKARARTNAIGETEQGFLQPLREIVSTGKTPAEVLLDLYAKEWDGDLSKIYGAMSF